ncbi:MAG: sigma-70 family RNA polymerase sigma factor [Roseburia sp.]|nr:sigma-70 family RNA polymerase sigma factor [Roseburia sp.]
MSKFRKEINSILCSLQKGDKSKQQELFNSTYNNLKIIALKYVIDKNDYEDVLMDAYLKIFKYIASFNNKYDGYNWICKIVQNVAYGYNKNYMPSISLDGISFTKILGSKVNEIADKDEILSVLCKLTEYEQRLIYLRYYEELSFSEMAKIIGKGKSTIHKQLSGIHDKINDLLKNGGRNRV